MDLLICIAAGLTGLFVILFALGAARLAGDADQQSDIIRRDFSGRHLPGKG